MGNINSDKERNCVNSVAFHHTAPLLAFGSNKSTVILSQVIPNYTYNSLVGHSDAVLSVAFHPTAPLLATGSVDSTVRLWLLSSDSDKWSATCVATLNEHSDSVNSVAFHPTAPILATGSNDCNVILWKIKNTLESLKVTASTPQTSAYTQLPPDGSSSDGGSIIRNHKKRSSRKLKRYASKRIKRNRNRNKYRKSKKAKTKRYPKLR